ncbi:hypothetical protein, partial [Shewanella indica]|uniref:hypothetical protein n=1 Tax=Shewanella indica TaxID=768528 RepID=UPI00399A8980
RFVVWSLMSLFTSLNDFTRLAWCPKLSGQISSVPDKIGGGGKSASHSYLFTPLNCFAGNAASQSF